MNNKQMMEHAKDLERQAAEVRRRARRKLPDAWRVGQVVRYLKDVEWGPSAGSVAVIEEFNQKDKRAVDEYQSFVAQSYPPVRWSGRYFTTPDMVEFVAESLFDYVFGLLKSGKWKEVTEESFVITGTRYLSADGPRVYYVSLINKIHDWNDDIVGASSFDDKCGSTIDYHLRIARNSKGVHDIRVESIISKYIVGLRKGDDGE